MSVHTFWVITHELLGQLMKACKVYRVCSRKPKITLTTILRIGLTSRKPKRIEWGFLEVVATLNTQNYPFESYRTIVAQAWIDNTSSS